MEGKNEGQLKLKPCNNTYRGAFVFYFKCTKSSLRGAVQSNSSILKVQSSFISPSTTWYSKLGEPRNKSNKIGSE